MVKRRVWLSSLTLILPLTVIGVSEAKISDGVASYYADRFNGRLTASGARFNMHALTAAHRTLGFGTQVEVTNKANGRSVVVTINDRGPYVSGRTIDLSKSAAKRIGMLGNGVAEVELEVLGKVDSSVVTRSGLTVAEAQKLMIDLF